MKKILIVGGYWDEENPKQSQFADLMAHEILKMFPCIFDIKNGGKLSEVEDIIKSSMNYNMVFWITNNLQHLAQNIKKVNPKIMFVTLKDNSKNKFSTKHIVACALRDKANLIIEKNKNNFSILDPLGNSYCTNENNLSIIVKALMGRLILIGDYTRIGSTKIGDAIEVPNQKEFFEIAKTYATRFHNIIHDKTQERNLGCVSFRCERGFPSFKHDNLIFISKRNADKRYIAKEDFVAVENELINHKVSYYGENKPSVDTPIQVQLYQKFPNVKYIIHAHVYVRNAKYTLNPIPCGCLEEVDEIMEVVKDGSKTNFAINLRGHGCILFADTLDFFSNIEFNDRDFLENQSNSVSC